tara:strand:- start:576 stop:1637 length:1062 start_codon:yes stop_codon:yes gene_type:complete
VSYSGRNRLFLAKEEATEGTDSTPAIGTDDLAVLDASPGISQEIEYAEVMPATPHGGQMQGPLIGARASASLTLPLYSKGLSGGVLVAPQWADVIMATFCDTSWTDATEEQLDITINPISPTKTDDADVVTINKKTFTLWEYSAVDGPLTTGNKLLRKMTGCRVQSATFNLPTRGIWTVDVNLVGLWVAASEVTTDLSSAADWDDLATDFVTGINADWTIGGQALKSAGVTITIETGADVAEGDDTATGYTETFIRDFTVTGSYDAILPALGTYDMFADVTDAADVAQPLAMTANGAFPATRTGGTGYGVKIAIPNLVGTGDVDRGTPLRFSRTWAAKRASSITEAPITISLL